METGLVCALLWVEVELQKGDQQPLLKTEDYGLWSSMVKGGRLDFGYDNRVQLCMRNIICILKIRYLMDILERERHNFLWWLMLREKKSRAYVFLFLVYL